ncbi:MAG: glycosyltransferase family 1 protein [Patescibacteria group bacterium]
MRITIDIRLLAKGGASGIEEYTRNLTSSLLSVDRVNDYSFFYNGFKKAPISQFSALSSSRHLSDNILEGGIPPAAGEYPIVDWKIPNKILDFSSHFLNWPKIDSLIKTDLFFSPHFNILSVKKTPRVITFHDLSFIHHPYFFSIRQKFWHWLQNVKKQAQSATQIIAVSEFTKTDLINVFGIPAEKIKVIYSGISEEFKFVTSDHRQGGAGQRPPPQRDKQATRPYILYLGTLEPRKNVEAVIRAFNILKTKPDFRNFQLILAGRPGWLYGNILKEAAHSPFQKDIVFLGAVRSAERADLYRNASVFVYPSFFEGFGFPPLEAQACGCPVVASLRTSLPEILGDSALFIDPWRVEETAAAIEELIGNQEKRRELIQAGFKNIQRFRWEKTTAATLEVFKTIV